MKTKILFALLFVAALALGNLSKISATVDEKPKEHIRNMASCGEGCYCCLNNTSTYCGLASCQ